MGVVTEDFKTQNVWAGYCSKNGVDYITKSCQVWGSMNSRCLEGGAMQKSCPTYVGCTVSENFKNFQFFANWYTRQFGYGCDSYQLDKDVLIQGNRVYSEDCCVLIPPALNSFFTTRSDGNLPPGVSKDKGRTKYRAALRISGKKVKLGTFNTLEEAEVAYKVAKEAEAYRWYERLRDGEFIVDPRVIERMRTWTFETN